MLHVVIVDNAGSNPVRHTWLGVKAIGYFKLRQRAGRRICYLAICLIQLDLPRCEDTTVTSNLDRVVAGSSPVALPFMQGVAQLAER